MQTTKEPTIEEVNGVIAEFMGAEWKKDDYGAWGYIFPRKQSPGVFGAYDKGALKYHTSWNWAIPAWQSISAAILKMVPFKIYESAYNHFRKSFYQCIDGCDNRAAARVIADAINWYNNNKQ